MSRFRFVSPVWRIRRRYDSYSTTSPCSGEENARVRSPSSLSCATRYLGLNPLRKSRKSFIVSARFTVVPQIARISSGSEDGAAGAERAGAEEGGIERCVASEGGWSELGFVFRLLL